MGTIALTEDERTDIEHRIAELEVEHSDLNDIIARLAETPTHRQAQVRPCRG